MFTARRIAEQRLGIRIPRATFYRWTQNGTILTVRVVNSVRVSTSALAKFLTLHTSEGREDFSDLTPALREEAQAHSRAIFETLSAEIASQTAPGEAP